MCRSVLSVGALPNLELLCLARADVIGEQVIQAAKVEFHHGDGNIVLKCRRRRACCTIDFAAKKRKEFVHCAPANARAAFLAENSVGLAGTCLAVRNNRHVVPVDRGENDGLDVCKDIFVCRLWARNTVKLQAEEETKKKGKGG